MKGPWSYSLANRILWGFYVFLVLVLVAVAIQWIDLSRLQWRLTMQDATAGLVDAVLEVRRSEKNWFLYRDPSDFEANIQNVEKVSSLIQAHREGFEEIFANNRHLTALERKLRAYEQLMVSEKNAVSAQNRSQYGGEIRALGKDLVDITYVFRREERSAISRTVDMVTRAAVLFGIVVTLLVLIMGQQLARSVVRPLQRIVECTRRIARGQFNPCEGIDEAVEIVTVHQAFRAMLNELERREAQLIQSKKLAALGTLVAGVAHELNNPLSNIGTSAQILKEEFDADSLDKAFGQEMLQQIVEQTDRAKRTVRSLLEFSREKEMTFEPIDLSVVFRETEGFLRNEVPARVTFEVQVLRDGKFWADKQRIQQALLNLLINALHAVGERGTVRLSGEVAPEANQVRMRVEDDGPGIPDEIREQIFDPFFTTKDVGEGSGLGLAVTQQIVMKHSGRIMVESVEGRGTAFEITLPVKREEELEMVDG